MSVITICTPFADLRRSAPAEIVQVDEVMDDRGRDRALVEVIRTEPVELEPRLEEHRQRLTLHCQRMLGSAFEAEDAVQETLMRAWLKIDRFEGRSELRSWLYRIATNVCLDMLQQRQRRPRPVDMATSESEPTTSTTGATTTGTDPAEVAAASETVRRAFLATLLLLPPRQRAVLILREVLRWKADEVAELLGTTPASVNSALQRARATLAARQVDVLGPCEPGDAEQRQLLVRYVDAFQRFDVDSLVSLLATAHHQSL